MKLALTMLICISFFFSQEEKGFKYDVYSQIYGRYELIRNAPIVSTFKLARVLFGGEGIINDQTDYKFEFQLAEKTELKHIFLDFKLDPAFKIRLGQFKYPFGLEGYESGKTFKFINKSTVSNEIAAKLGAEGGDNRDIGLSLNGDYKIIEEIKYNYNLSILNGNGINKEDSINYVNFVFNNSFTYDNIKLGIALYKGNSGKVIVFEEKAVNVFLTIEEKDKFKFQAENFVQNIYTEQIINKDLNSSGFYFSANIFADDKIEFGARYGEYQLNSTNTAVSVEEALNITYHVSKKFRINLEFENRENDYHRFKAYNKVFLHSQVLYLQVHTNL